jgi:hypothetical protein
VRARLARALAVAGLAASVVTPGPAGGHDARLVVAEPPVLVDGAGRVVGQILADDSTGYYVWRRVEGLDLLLRAGPEGLTSATLPPRGLVAYETADCTGATWFMASLVPGSGTPFFAVDAPGPGDVLFVADGLPQLRAIQTVWTPGAVPPCQPYGGPFFPIPPARPILDLGAFPPPHRLR